MAILSISGSDPGAQGPQGADGAQGNQGPQGFDGSQGSQGPQGFDGIQGVPGPQGIDGAQGSQGPQGNDGTGAQGADGAQGPQGPQGFQGNQGPQGNDGSGSQGPEGSQGPQGPQGNDGSQGGFGMQGPQGSDGSQGPQGAQGPQGDKTAIVPWLNAAGVEEYRELICVEMPEARFEDIVSVRLIDSTQTVRLDEVFFDVCEEGTIQPVSIVPSLPVLCAARVSGRTLVVEAQLGRNESVDVVVRLSGIRKGRRGKRFAAHTRDEMLRNDMFWHGWKNR